ncbi:MAG: hypothetical protein V4496_07120 [Pseudomonadota bacterium]
MSILTEKFAQVEKLKTGLSKESQVAFDYAMEVTAQHCETEQSNRNSLKKMIAQSRKKLLPLIKKQDEFKACLAQITNQSPTSAAPTLVDGLKAWTVSLLSPEKAFEKIHNPKQ